MGFQPFLWPLAGIHPLEGHWRGVVPFLFMALRVVHVLDLANPNKIAGEIELIQQKLFLGHPRIFWLQPSEKPKPSPSDAIPTTNPITLAVLVEMLKSIKKYIPAFLLPAMALPVFSQGFLQDYTLQVHTGYAAGSSTDIDGTDIDIDVGEGYSFGIGIGRQVNVNLRVQLDWTYHHLDVDEVVGSFLDYPTPYRGLKDITTNYESELSYSSVLLNVYYDKEVNGRTTVFGGIGAGFSIVEASFHGTILQSLRGFMQNAQERGLDQYYDSDTGGLTLPGDKQGVAFAWQVGLGAIFELNQNLDLLVAWKYFNPGSVDDLGHLDINNLEIALRYLF